MDIIVLLAKDVRGQSKTFVFAFPLFDPIYFLFCQTDFAWGEISYFWAPEIVFVKGSFFNKTCFKEQQQFY